MPNHIKALKNKEKRKKLSDKADSLMELINNMQTEELVIAFCGALGSGTSKVAKKFEDLLKNKNYETRCIKVSNLIIDASEEHLANDIVSCPKADRIKKLQDYGNSLRDKFGNDILAQKIISNIAIHRKETEKSSETDEENSHIRNRRHVTLIDSLKHPDEYILLEAIYGSMFYMVGVLCPESIRINRLENEDGFSRELAVSLTERDKNEALKYGQKFVKTIQHSDFFIRNADDNIESLERPIERYLGLMLGKRNITPTVHEYAMNAAHAASLRSGCMSRQVGAAIVSAEGDLIATGRNDVPRGGGGLYGPENGNDDARCVMKATGKCQSNDKKNEIIKEIENVFKEELKEAGNEPEALIEALKNKISKIPQLQGLIEFSRAVHAEMDAITTAARMSTTSLKKGALYCTTFPCHHCARHIVACGITRLYYIEPYEKSLAFSLHSDSIEIDASETQKDSHKLRIIPFEGVAPKQYGKLFDIGTRKEDGVRNDVDLSTAKPVLQKFLFHSLDFENAVATYHEEQLAPHK